MRILAVLLVLASVAALADKEKGLPYQTMYCVHPDDESKATLHNLVTCHGPTAGHGMDQIGQTDLTDCANCKQQHPGSPEACEIRKIDCIANGRRPASDESASEGVPTPIIKPGSVRATK